MKEQIYKSIPVVGWFWIFFKISETWPFPWSFVCVAVGFSALYCTVELMKPEDRSHTAASGTGGLSGLPPILLGYVFVRTISAYLPPHWSEISPFMVIVAVYGISRLWPDRKVEEKPEDALSSKDSTQGA